MSKERKISYIATLALIASLYLALTRMMASGMINSYQSGIINFICINIILAVSLNLTIGCLGQIAIGHAGFMSVGAYTAALLTKSGMFNGLPGYLLALLIGGLMAGIIGVAIGIPALRLKGYFLAIITLAFGEIIRVLIEYFDFTGGAQGLKGIPRNQNFTVIFIVMVLSVVLMYTIMKSRHGRAILTIRENEIASEAVGINTTYYKTFAFAVSAIFAGIAGGIYAHNMGILDAKLFDYNYSINILAMVVLGGMGSFTGAIMFAIVLTILPEVLRGFVDYRMIVYSLLLIIMMMFRPTGLLGLKEFQLSAIISRLIRNKRDKEAEKGDMLHD